MQVFRLIPSIPCCAIAAMSQRGGRHGCAISIAIPKSIAKLWFMDARGGHGSKSPLNSPKIVI